MGKLYAESRNLSKADMNFMLQKWLSELALIRAKFTAKVPGGARGVLRGEADNIITIDVRPPAPDASPAARIRRALGY